MEGEWRISYFNVLVSCSLVIIGFICRLRSRLGRFYTYSLWLNLIEVLGLKLGNLTNLVLCGIDPTYHRYYLLRPCSLACKNGFLVCNCTQQDKNIHNFTLKKDTNKFLAPLPGNECQKFNFPTLV